MYRARVEAVSGLKVRAGGKWLTCIGNRTVKAGDMIWTDGRCVYGHDREAQTPIVIANSAEDLAIPIQIGNLSETLFTYRKNDLKQVSSGEYTGNLLNDTKGHVFYSTADAANIDKAGNLYIIDGSKANYVYESGNGSAPNKILSVDCDNPNPRVIIRKNKQAVREILLGDIIESTAEAAKAGSSDWTGVQQPFTFSEPNGLGSTHGEAVFDAYADKRSAHVTYAFIENEQSWAIIYMVSVRYEHYVDWWGWGEGFYPGSPLYYFHDADSDVLRIYYINSSGEKKILYQVNLVWNERAHGTASVDLRTNPGYLGCFTEQATSNTDDVNIPMQDGYYFKLKFKHTPYPHYPYVMWNPMLGAEYSVFSPNGKHLFNWSVNPEAYSYKRSFSICRLAGGKYLFGIGLPLDKTWGDWEPEFNGLYVYQDGELTRLFKEPCLNYRLRQMKKYKHWWERIQPLE